MSRGTIHRTIRIEDALWLPAKAKAESEGINLSDIIRGALRTYIEPDPLGQNEIWRQASPSPEYWQATYPEGTMTFEEWGWENRQTEERAKRLSRGEEVGPRLTFAEHLRAKRWW